MQEARVIPIHQSLHRHNSVMGGERTLVMSSALICLLVGIGGLTMVSGIAALIAWIFSIFVARRMFKTDPLMSQVWMRHIKQNDYYDAKSSRWRMVEGFKERKK